MKTFSNIKRIPNLTSIRFFLAVIVILFHVPQFFRNRGFPFYDNLAIFHKGKEAVYVFFALSGFLIIRQLFNEKTKFNTIDLKSFFMKRVLRIFPLYYLILIFGFLNYRLILPSLGFSVENDYNLLWGIFLSITFFANIFNTYSPGGIIEILWSIGIEEQFYLFIAPTLFLIPLKRIRTFLLLFSIGYFLLYFSEIDFLRKYSMLFFYFSFSGLLSIILLKNKKFQKFISSCRFPIIFLFLLYFLTPFFKDNLTLIFYHLFSVILFSLTLCALSQKKIALLDNKTFNYLGKISYGIYMYHPIAILVIGLFYLKFLNKLNLNYAFYVILANCLIIGLTILLSHLSYKYYESYFLKIKKKYQLRRKKNK